MDRFRAAIEGIDGPRTGNRLERDLQEVLFIVLCASLCGAEVTMDAMHCQRATAEAIVAEGGETT